MSRRKVCLLGSTGKSGGVIRYSKEMIKNLTHKRCGFSVDYREYEKPFGSPALNFMLGASSEDFSRYDLVHNLPAYPYYSLSRRNTISVTTAHEFQRRSFPELNSIQERSLNEKLWGYWVVEKSIEQMLSSDYLMANSIQTKNEAIGLGYEKDRIFYTPFGLDRRFLKRRKERKEGKTFRVGFIGTLSERKNIKLLLNAFRQIEGKDIILELWGDNLYGEGELSLPKNVFIKGKVPESKMVDLYDSFDLFVYMSSYEGYGIPIQEAKARGLPVIIYKHGAISPEVARYCFKVGSDGELAELVQKFKNNGYDKRRRLEQIKYARTFTWELTAQKTVDAYNQILDER